MSFLINLVIPHASLHAEENFKKAAVSDYVAIGLNDFEQALEIINQPTDYSSANCSKGGLVESLEKNFWEDNQKNKTDQPEEAKCFCDVDSLSPEDKNLVLSFLGEIKSQSITFDTGNDNFLHSALRATPYKKYDGDDRGRTFGLELNYHVSATEGEMKLGLESTGFGQMIKVGNARKDADKRYYLNFREYNQLNLELNKNFSTFDSDKDHQRNYLTTEFSFYNETDKGGLSRSIQESYHTLAKNKLGITGIQYNYQALAPERNALGAKVGLGKEIFLDLKNWKCQMKGELKVGFSHEIDGKSKTSPEIEARAEASLSHKAIPWIILSSWLQTSKGYNGEEFSYNVAIKGQGKVKKVKVEPFVGVEKHFSDIDKKFDQQGGGTNEFYHKLGVSFKF